MEKTDTSLQPDDAKLPCIGPEPKARSGSFVGPMSKERGRDDVSFLAEYGATLDYQRDEHRVHLIVYHLIWCPRRRKPILTGKLKDRFEELITMKCQEKGWIILTLAVQPDHIHLFVRVWPSESASDVVKELKGITSFHLRQEFKSVLSKLPSLWTRSYFASTAGAVSAQTIQHYLDAQKGV